MTTNNIISTPDITGNIGSCTSQSIEVPTEGGFFTYQYMTVVTNSCTGKVMDYPSWGFGAGAYFIGLLFIFIVFGWSVS